MPRKLSDKLEKKTGRHAWEVVNRWRFEKRGGRCEIDVFGEARGKWARAAVVVGAPGMRAEALAGYVVEVLNEKQQQSVALNEAVYALETILEEGVTWATEIEADSAVERLKEQTALLREVQEVLDLVVAEGVTASTKARAQQTLAGLKNCRIIPDQF
jgi:hypothetical protein